jgi:type I restriction enzyme S subunit
LAIQQIEAFQIPLPPEAHEQRAIAAALSDADALIAALDALIGKQRDVKQAAMQQLLTGKTRLLGFDGASESLRQGYKQTEVGVIPVDWGVARIADLASITTGSRNTQDRIEDGAFPFFVRSQTIERINTYSFDGEAVLTAGDGVGTGKIFHYINGKFDFHQRVYKISEFSDRLIGYYFYLYFSNNFFDRIMSMTAKSSVDSVRREMIADMQIPLPQVEEQRAIAVVLCDMDAEIAAVEARRDKTRALKQGLMQVLLTGRIRLI